MRIHTLSCAAASVYLWSAAAMPATPASRMRTFHLDAPLTRVFPLFTARGERDWAPGWQPQILSGGEERGSGVHHHGAQWRDCHVDSHRLPALSRKSELCTPGGRLEHRVGRRRLYGSTQRWNGYLREIHFDASERRGKVLRRSISLAAALQPNDRGVARPDQQGIGVAGHSLEGIHEISSGLDCFRDRYPRRRGPRRAATGFARSKLVHGELSGVAW